MKVLITEDQNTSRLLLEEWLLTWGYEPILAVDGVEAWEILQNSGNDMPRLIILDWLMPRMDGLELCRRIKSDPRFPCLYVIMVTVKNTQEDLRHALSVGVDDFLSKPITPEDLRSRLAVAERMLYEQECWLDDSLS